MTAVACWVMPSGGLAAWCADCERWHFHGRGGSPAYALTFGARVAHCLDRALPGSYELVSCGFADAEVLKAIRQRRPPPQYEQRVLRALSDGLDCYLDELDDMRRQYGPHRTTEFELAL